MCAPTFARPPPSSIPLSFSSLSLSFSFSRDLAKNNKGHSSPYHRTTTTTTTTGPPSPACPARSSHTNTYTYTHTRARTQHTLIHAYLGNHWATGHILFYVRNFPPKTQPILELSQSLILLRRHPRSRPTNDRPARPLSDLNRHSYHDHPPLPNARPLIRKTRSDREVS